jgi:multidrug resistance efflux pump
MTDAEITADDGNAEGGAAASPVVPDAIPAEAQETPRRGGIVPTLARYVITLTAVAIAAVLVVEMWSVYMASPWTRDGTVRVYVVTMAPEVAGKIVKLQVRDNQFVRKGDLLMVIDPTNYEIAVKLAQAAVEQAEAVMTNARADSTRRDRLMRAAVSDEEKETFKTRWLSAEATHLQALANLEQAQVNLNRTRIVSPVNGYVTNLLAQLGDYAVVGEKLISVVNSDSFWVDGYFVETNIGKIAVGDRASIKLMGRSEILRGHVDSIARGISVPNAQPNGQGLATVNPIFTWVRLAQRIPVRIHIDEVPPSVILSAGMTATVQVDPNSQPKSDLETRRHVGVEGTAQGVANADARAPMP